MRIFSSVCLLSLIYSGMSQAGIIITGDVEPVSSAQSFMNKVGLHNYDMDFINSQADFSFSIGRSSAINAGVCEGACSYYAAAFFQQIETGELIPNDAIHFLNNSTSGANLERLLSRLTNQPVFTHSNINITQNAGDIVTWLNENLLEGEPAIVSVEARLSGAQQLRHSVNAIKVNGEVYIYDVGYRANGIPAEDFFNGGIREYQVNLRERVSVTRVLRRNVRYQFTPEEVAQREISVDAHHLDLRGYSDAELEAGLNHQDLLAEKERSPEVFTEQCVG